MPVSEQLSQDLPYLRRYARALTGSQGSGDTFVRTLLEAALSDRPLLDQISGGRVSLFRAFSQVWSTAHVEVSGGNAGDGRGATAGKRLAAIPPEHRQALLLTTLEDFSTDDAATILGLEPVEVEALLTRAITEIEGETATSVLIIEDEPLIAMQLENLIEELGHSVAGIAATRTQAVELFGKTQPGLVLADVQLADGSSGIDAVEDILANAAIPVVFITAYPEKLLTGERPEPTYLVTKPFREETVRATISQALFFGGGQLNS
jgi:CheY-like chemotaxis protein/DNA-directed RNA polymerase specialized sigma24 family protein